MERAREGDDFHPQENVAKMSAGTPLTDDDRVPWLDQLAREVASTAASGRQVVFSCSALKLSYRTRLKATLPDLITVCLTLDAETATRRAGDRADHFMPSALVESQLATLELPEDEPRTVMVDATQPFDHVLADVERLLDVRQFGKGV